ncbi:MFS transporter, partial [Pleurocapsa sp. CCALA 161]
IGPVISGLLVSLNYTAPLWITGGLTILVAGFAVNLKSQFKCNKPVLDS